MISNSMNLRLACRLIRKHPSFSAAVVLTLGLGIGINSLIFSVVNAVLLAPLPFGRVDRLVAAWEVQLDKPAEKSVVSPANFADWRRHAAVFAGMEAYYPAKINVAGQGDPELVSGARVTPGFFDLVEVRPVLGSLPGANGVGGGAAEPVVVLGHAYWQDRFGGDRGVLGQTLRIDDRACRIAAVLPPGFALPPAAIWVPEPLSGAMLGKRDTKFLRVVARLAPGVSLQQAKLALVELTRGLEREYPATNHRWRAALVPLREELVGAIRPVLLIAMAVVGFVLLLACINILNLLLARAQGRRRELAVRTALGAQRSDLLRQLFAECLLLAVMGGGLGLLLAFLGLPVLVAMSPVDLPGVANAAVDGRVLAFTLVLALGTGVIFGLLPSWLSTRVNLHTALKEGGLRSSGPVRAREALIVAEMGLAFALLVGAGLMVKTCLVLLATDPGFRPARVLAMKVLLPKSRYAAPADQINFFQRAIEELRVLPGVDAAAGTTTLPLAGVDVVFDFRIVGRPGPGPGEHMGAGFDAVTPDYFSAMGVPLRSGRTFTAADRAGGAQVAVISESLARRYFPGEDPVGQHLLVVDAGDHSPREIVGVVGDVLHTDLQSGAAPALYLPFAQYPVRSLGLIVKSRGEPALIAAAARRAISTLDPQLAVADVRTLEQVLLASFARQRWTAWLLGAFSLLGLLLAAVGIYGVMAYYSAQRAREIGIRMALGASRPAVLGLVLGKALRLSLVGIAGGSVIAHLLGRSLSSMLFGVRLADPATFALMALLLVAVALLAGFAPARRAAGLDPAEVLRAE